MVNRGAVSQTIGVGGSYTIPEGYHNGSGKVSFSATAGTATATSTAATGNQTLNLNAAGYYNKVTVNQTAAYNAGYAAGLAAAQAQIKKARLDIQVGLTYSGYSTKINQLVNSGSTYSSGEQTWYAAADQFCKLKANITWE